MQSSRNFWRSLLFLTLIAALCGAMVLPVLAPVQAAPMEQAGTNIVISQVYGAGGNSGATYQNDFVELFNPTTSSISVNGWSIQYASATGTGLFSSNVTNLSGTILSGQYYLVQLDSNDMNGSLLPSADAVGSTEMSATNGKVILANTTSGLSCNGGSIPCTAPELANIVDLVGYGTADFYEGSGAAPALSATESDLRDVEGCTDTNNNNVDFLADPPNPRNSSSIGLVCGVGTYTPTLTPSITLTPTITPTETITPTPTITPTTTITPTSTTSPSATITPAVTLTPLPTLELLINEVAWAGTAASTSDEWIELYNPGTSAIPLSGWILRALDGTPTINLTGSIPAGGYYLLERTDDTAVSDITADLIFSGDVSNSGEIFQLFDPSNRLIDTANSNGGSWPAGSSTTFGSMERSGLVADSDSVWFTNTGVVRNGLDANNNPINGTPKRSNWATTVTATPSPQPTSSPRPTSTRTATPLPPPELVAINEFVPRPGRDWNNDGQINTRDEFIELINHGTVVVNLNGWTLDDEANTGSSPFVIASSIALQPGERIVFYGSETGLLLSDGGDGVRLLKPNGALIDAFNYTVVNYPDQSYCRLPDNGGLDDWNRNCFPTPGLGNSAGRGSANPPASGNKDEFCPVADTLPLDFFLAECDPFGHNIWSRFYWDDTGWFGEQELPDYPGKWVIFVD